MLVALLWATALHAQEPLIEVDFEESSAIPGQVLTLRITVLVPTWLPKPVVFPTFDAPNVLVRLPEGSTGPTSRTIDGETWSGVSRRYLISPMVPGPADLPAQDLIVTWAEPGQTDPLVQTIALDPITVTGVTPEGTEDLSPFLAAENVTLTGEVSEAEMPLAAGDSLTITLTAAIEGTSAMFLPQLFPPVSMPGVAAYPAEPLIVDKEDRGKQSGTRTETLTLVAQSGGGGELAPVEVRWYNLSSKKVETATTEGLTISVDAPDAIPPARDLRSLALYGAGLVLVVLVGVAALRWVVPPVRAALAARRQRIRASEHWAYKSAQQAARTQDLDAFLRALDVWARRCGVDPRGYAALQSALSAVGQARYGRTITGPATAWDAVTRALPQARAHATSRTARQQHLPPLNRPV